MTTIGEELGLAPHRDPDAVADRYARLGCEAMDFAEAAQRLGKPADSYAALQQWMIGLGEDASVDAIVMFTPEDNQAQPRILLRDDLSATRRQRALHHAMYALQFPRRFAWQLDQIHYVPSPSGGGDEPAENDVLAAWLVAPQPDLKRQAQER